eukprot:1428120-Prymnesium_polylepis.1
MQSAQLLPVSSAPLGALASRTAEGGSTPQLGIQRCQHAMLPRTPHASIRTLQCGRPLCLTLSQASIAIAEVPPPNHQ